MIVLCALHGYHASGIGFITILHKAIKNMIGYLGIFFTMLVLLIWWKCDESSDEGERVKYIPYDCHKKIYIYTICRYSGKTRNNCFKYIVPYKTHDNFSFKYWLVISLVG